MPYRLTEIGKEPDRLLLRRGDILNWIGIGRREFALVVKSGVLPWKRLRPNGGRVFRKADVKRVFLEGFRVTGG
jgi:hypothetical protein